MGRSRIMSAAGVCRRPVLFQAAVFLGLAILGCHAGCTRRALRPTELPLEYQVSPQENVATIDFSRLAPYSVSSQVVDRGDVLEVSMVTDLESLAPLVVPVRVGEDGMADVPQIGKVPVAGLELEDAEQAISAASVARGVYRTPHITVAMKHQRSNRVTVVGSVKNPSVYELPRGSSTVLAAIVAAGGLSEEAGLEVEIHHSVAAGNVPGMAPLPGPRVAGSAPGQLTALETSAARPLQTVRINLASTSQDGNIGQTLNDGDVVMIPKRQPRTIYVSGLVQKPDQYEIPPGENMCVLDAIARAGGVNTKLADEVLIIRRGRNSQEPIQIQTTISKAKQEGTANVLLAPGDVVNVEETPQTFVWDAMRNMIRFAIGGTMTVF